MKILRVEVTFNGCGLMGCRCVTGTLRAANCRGLLGDEVLLFAEAINGPVIAASFPEPAGSIRF